MSILNVEQLAHAFGDKAVFRNVSFRLLRGERVGLVGVNGAGKSTLMHILTGELLPDAGRIEWLPDVKRGYMQQHVSLNETDSIRTFLQGAFETIFALERQMGDLADRMATSQGDELNRLLLQFGHIQEQLEQHDIYGLDAKIEKVASGLGLTEIGLDREVGLLSGGQRTKVLLARLLLEQPDVLLLDEPTNYLDTSHIAWLTEYLSKYPHAFVLISHDTSFVNEVVNVIYHLEHQQLTRYVGNYQQFRSAYELRSNQTLQAYERQQEEIEKLETYIKKNIARASTSKQAKSRVKRLEKIERIDKPSLSPTPRFSFNVSAQPVRTVLETDQLTVGYNSPLFPPLNLSMTRGEKVALIGLNGVGKTTLLKTVLGHIPALEGEVILGDRVRPAYFAQESATSNDHTALEEVWRHFTSMTQSEVRKALAQCGLKTEHIFQQMKALSGGEQAKVRLCKLMLSNSNWLVLDEPTNHLDVAAQNALREAFTHYEGTLLIVSHDPEFYADWVTTVWDAAAWRRQHASNR